MEPPDKRRMHRPARGGWRCITNAHPDLDDRIPEQWIPLLAKHIVGMLMAELRVRFPDVPDRLRILPHPQPTPPSERPAG